jgi:hypothetical protein
MGGMGCGRRAAGGGGGVPVAPRTLQLPSRRRTAEPAIPQTQHNAPHRTAPLCDESNDTHARARLRAHTAVVLQHYSSTDKMWCA